MFKSRTHSHVAATVLFTLFICVTTLEPLSQSNVFGGDAAEIGFVKEWGKKGKKEGEFYFPIAIAVSAADELLITDHLNNRVQKFDINGKFVGQFAVLGNPAAIALDQTGNLYITHFRASGRSTDSLDNRVSVYTRDGRLLRQWGETGAEEGQFDCPGGIAISTDGRVFVADQTNHRIQVFDNEGRFLFKWGEYGSQAGQFGGDGKEKSRTGGPQFLAFDKSGNLWTTEGSNCRIQKFTADGKHLLSWGTKEDEPGGFGGYFAGFKNLKPTGLVGPIALAFDKHQFLWVSAVSGRVQQFAQDGKYLRGLVEKQGMRPGQFYAPHDVAFDSKGFLYVVDAFNHRIQKFAPP